MIASKITTRYAKSLLDFQSTYQNSLEASVLIGRKINVERLMELSLAGNLEGLQKEQIKLRKKQ